MSIIKQFRNSLKLPNKQALFQLNRVSMRDTLVYLFSLYFLLFLPNVVMMIAHFDVSTSPFSFSQYLLQIILFYPFFMLFLVVTSISLVALVSWGVSIGLGRNLIYQQLWKMTGFALTIPLCVYQLLTLLSVPDGFVGVFASCIFFYTIIRMISHYPKKRTNRREKKL
ncbi:hypothetical protein J416_15522 [Gracilibacillus halophilus YIM-C55.5]|uniref:DUF1189 domain-containing protein n=1 Tax=Gracilibacillus halophilus YIM-C55.5 TaxID=1308866 RepID=N4WH78_9BACI|nr:hypothetical protein [Gracilibacillus halophilus]ENH95542.1 hypothetical protein J416_15522 [Gracilibacillus halophilus YIM-C55.5]